jgi:hypothetical protein
MTANEIDELVSLGMIGGRFAEHAASRLLSGMNCWGETRYEMTLARFARKDRRAVVRGLLDWSGGKLTMHASKFIPGDHYHVNGRKFNTLAEVIEYVEGMGYDFGGVQEKFFYKD